MAAPVSGRMGATRLALITTCMPSWIASKNPKGERASVRAAFPNFFRINSFLYEDDEHPETEADLCDFVDMFTDGYTSDEHGNIETSEEDEILATGDYEDDDDVQRKQDIDRCLECARHNVQKLHDMIEAVERAKAQGATKFAAIDFNDYDGDCDDDD